MTAKPVVYIRGNFVYLSTYYSHPLRIRIYLMFVHLSCAIGSDVKEKEVKAGEE